MKDLSIILAPDCHECDEVQEFVTENNITIDVVEMKTDEISDSEHFVFPVLKSGETVLAYGSDIINYIKKNKG